jgi:hypothetical protein
MDDDLDYFSIKRRESIFFDRSYARFYYIADMKRTREYSEDK